MIVVRISNSCAVQPDWRSDIQSCFRSFLAQVSCNQLTSWTRPYRSSRGPKNFCDTSPQHQSPSSNSMYQSATSTVSPSSWHPLSRSGILGPSNSLSDFPSFLPQFQVTIKESRKMTCLTQLDYYEYHSMSDLTQQAPWHHCHLTLRLLLDWKYCRPQWQSHI